MSTLKIHTRYRYNTVSGEYVEDTIVKFLDIADVSQIGKQNTQQLIRRTKRVCKDSLSVTAGYDEGTDTQWRISH